MNPEAGPSIQALMVDGIHRAIEKAEKKREIIGEIIEVHPEVKRLAESADVEVVAVKIESFLLLNGVSDSHFEYA